MTVCWELHIAQNDDDSLARAVSSPTAAIVSLASVLASVNRGSVGDEDDSRAPDSCKSRAGAPHYVKINE